MVNEALNAAKKATSATRRPISSQRTTHPSPNAFTKPAWPCPVHVPFFPDGLDITTRQSNMLRPRP